MKKTAEVVIIGGGISGCTIAYNLSKENIDTVLVEKGSLANGATGRSGSMIWNIWGQEPDKELAKLGLSTTKKFAELEEELDYDIEYTPSDYLILVTPEEEENYRKAMAITQKN